MGFRKCTGKPIIHLRTKGEAIPFDVNTVRTFEYDLTDLDNVDEVKKRLEQTILAFSFEDKDAQVDDKNVNDQLLSQEFFSILYHIQDSIEELKNQVAQRDTETIQTIMQTSLNNASKDESLETIMAKAILPELIKNPKAFQNLMQISEMAGKMDK